MKLHEDKSRFINNLPWNSEEEKQKVLGFFKSHANLESKIQNWQSKDKESLVNEIRDLISEVEKASLEKEKAKQGYRGNIDWEAHDCRYLGEDKKWVYITPLSWEGAKFCDSAECGGAGAKWCIGYEKSDNYWVDYTLHKGVLFLMKFNKHPKNKQEDLKFMIEGYLGKDVVNIWDQTDHKKEYPLSETEKEYLGTIQEIWADARKEWLGEYFDNPESGVYVAKNGVALQHIKDIRADLRVFKAEDGVVFQNVENASYMFAGCTSLTSIDTSAFVNVKNTREMFWGCTSLTSIDTSGFKRVKTAEQMFKGCTSLTSIDASGFVNVEYASNMFGDCTSLASIDTSGFKNVENAWGMFWGCTSLASIDTSGFKNVTDATYMFRGCISLTSIDTSGFKNVEDAQEMFHGCTSLTSIDTSGFRSVSYAQRMFWGCTSLTSIDTSGFKNVKYATGMFKECTSLTSIDTSGFVSVKNAPYMFLDCASLASIDTSGFVNVEDTFCMFDGCASLKTYIPGSNDPVNERLEKIGAKPVKKLGESFRRRVIEEILEE